MMVDYDNPLEKEFLGDLYKDKREAWGDDLTRPRQFIIGRLNADGSVSTVVTSGEYNRVWVREPGLDTGDAVQATNSVLQPHEISRNRPVMVKMERGNFVITNKAVESANYDAQLPTSPQKPVYREQFNVALITPSVPDSSFYAYYRGGMINYGDGVYLSTDIPSSDFSGTVPVANALSIKVEYNPTAGTWHETTGSAFAFTSMRAAFKNGDLDTIVTDGRILWGWIRLYDGQAAIEDDDIELAGNMFNTVDPSKFVWIAPDSSARNIIQPTGDYVPLTVRGFAGTNSADIVRFQEGLSGQNVFVIEDNGQAYFQNQQNSTSSFRIRTLIGAAVLQVDTQNSRVGVNTASLSQTFNVGPGSSEFNKLNAAGNMNINSAQISEHYDLLLGGDGVLAQKETVTPTADSGYGKIYPKADDNLYFQDGAGNEEEVITAAIAELDESDMLLWDAVNGHWKNWPILKQQKEPTGFEEGSRVKATLSFDNVTRTLTLSHLSDYTIWDNDNVPTLITGDLTRQISDDEGTHYVYYQNGILTSVYAPGDEEVSTLISVLALTSIVGWNKDKQETIYLGEERHGIQLDGATHLELHFSVGTWYRSGLGLANFDIDGSGNDDSSVHFSIANGNVYDEDIELIADNLIQELSPIAELPIYYKTGANNWRRFWITDAWQDAHVYSLGDQIRGDDSYFEVTTAGTSGGVEPVWAGNTEPGDTIVDNTVTWTCIGSPRGNARNYIGGNYLLAFNEFVGAAWQQTEVGSGDYVLVHVFATNNLLDGQTMVAIQGQGQYSTIADAREGAANEVSTLSTTGLPFAEFVPIATVIYQTALPYNNESKARTRTTDTGDDYVDFRQSRINSTGSTASDHGGLSSLGWTVSGHIGPATSLAAFDSGGGATTNTSLLDGSDVSTLHNHDADYVELSGDIMTGTLQINGDLGIGTAPAVAFHVLREGGNPALRFQAFDGVPNIQFYLANGTEISPTSLTTGDILGQVSFVGYESVEDTYTPQGRITVTASEDWAANARGTRMDFYGTEEGDDSLFAFMGFRGDTNTLIVNFLDTDTDFRVDGTAENFLLFTNAGTNRVGIGDSTPDAKLDISQSDVAGATPVLMLEQLDVSEEMIEFATTIGVGNAIEAIGGKTLTTTHFIKVTLPGALTRYIPCGTIA